MYKICYVTSSRADYGRVREYLGYLNKDKEVDLELLLTGAVLEEKYGNVKKQIEKDGFKVAYSLKLNFESTENEDIIKNMSVVLKEFGNYFSKNKYDLVIILGDRYEILSVAIAAAMNKQTILHIHGGEITLGNYDEFIRHSITKMSKYHFTSTEEYRKRVIQLGEEPLKVYNVGAMSLENCKKISKNDIDDSIRELEKEKYFVVLFHPETMTDSKPDKQIDILLNATSYYKNEYMFIFIGTNTDTGSNKIRKAINEYVKQNDNTRYYESLDTNSYYWLVKNSIALIGNSSSGIIEAPTLGCYTINIGDRQKGRVKAKSIFDVDCIECEIKNTIDKVLKKSKSEMLINPYYKYNSNSIAYKLTKRIIKNEDNLIKNFYDL